LIHKIILIKHKELYFVFIYPASIPSVRKRATAACIHKNFTKYNQY